MAKTKLIPAPLDEKNVTTDWIEEMFDDQSALYGKNRMLGLVDCAAVLASWSAHILMWKVLDGDSHEAIMRLIERYEERYPDEKSPFIVEKQVYTNVCVMRFYWKPEE